MKIILAILCASLLLGGTIYYFQSPSSIESLSEEEHQKLLQNPELAEGMGKVLEYEQYAEDADEREENPGITLPDAEEALRNAEEQGLLDEPVEEGSDPELNRFNELNKRTHEQSTIQLYNEEITALEKEIPADERRLEILIQAGKNEEAMEVQANIRAKLERLKELSNSAP